MRRFGLLLVTLALLPAIALAIHFNAPMLVSKLEKPGQVLDQPVPPMPGERRL